MIIDFHSHVLPALDHGTSSLKTSLAQLELAKDAGVEVVVATSHFYPHMHNAKDFAEKREKAYSELTSALKDSKSPKIIKAAEVLICEGLEKLPDLDLLCIEGTRTILLELPFYPHLKNEYVETVERLIENGYGIILAHVDRYDPENIEKLIRLGAKAQINASAFSHLLVKKSIKKWLETEDLVYAIGSDIHGPDESAYKKFTRAINRMGKAASTIMLRSESVILNALKEINT